MPQHITARGHEHTIAKSGLWHYGTVCMHKLVMSRNMVHLLELVT